jgi:hypothetical protein
MIQELSNLREILKGPNKYLLYFEKSLLCLDTGHFFNLLVIYTLLGLHSHGRDVSHPTPPRTNPGVGHCRTGLLGNTP